MFDEFKIKFSLNHRKYNSILCPVMISKPYSSVTYADDTKISLPNKCDNHHNAINAAIIRLQNCILEVLKCMTSNALKINEEKTDFIIFNNTNVPLTSDTSQIDDNSIPMSCRVIILVTQS